MIEITQVLEKTNFLKTKTASNAAQSPDMGGILVYILA